MNRQTLKIEIFCAHPLPKSPLLKFSEKTKGQQLKGKIVSAFFTLFPHFSTHFLTIFQSLSPRAFLKLEAFLKRIKRKNQPFCTLVVANLFSSNVN